MSLTAGTRLGAYEVVAPIGAGGMGEVYRAHDARLNREVAIKVLPAAVAADTQRLERFAREARAASALNHPNIVTVHELGTHEGAPYIVTELLDGRDLRAAMDGRPLPVRRALEYATQILDGLAAAHEKGIVHRDLKPENIFVTRDGRIKILDFGLARVDDAPRAERETQSGLTDPGMVLGTAGYMAPEQVRGLRADHRSDLFSFGVILYEMLSGRPAFAGDTAAETMTAVLKDEPPDLHASGLAVHPALEKVVRRCLEKEPERRFHSATDLGFALGTVQTLSDSHAGVLPPVPRRLRGLIGAVAVAGVLLIVAIAIPARTWFSAPAGVDRPSLRLAIAPPPNTAFSHLAVSPDGRWLAFTAATGAKVQLWVRAMDEPESRPLAATDGASLPFWSPDSRFIGYFAAGKLRKIEPSGGVSTALGDVGVATGGSWNQDGVILFGSLGGTGLSKISAAGGPIERVIAPNLSRHETDFTSPMFLPDGRHFFYSIFSGGREGRGTFLASLDGGEPRRIVDAGNVGLAEVPGAGAFLFFVRETALMVQPFDLQSLQPAGEAWPLTDVVGSSYEGSGTAVARRAFTVSRHGLVIFDPVPTRLDSHLAWVDRKGGSDQLIETLNDVSTVRLSPDGRRFAAARRDRALGNADLWVSSAVGDRPDRFTFDPANDLFAIWSPDGSQIVWASNRDGVYQLYRKASAGSGNEEVLLRSPAFKFPTDWTADGKHIIFRQVDPVTHYDIWALPTGAGAEPFPLLKTDANEAAAVVSPDGKWLAYSSDESSRYEVYVQGFPGGGGKRQVSTLGGNGPLWRGDGRELYFHAADGNLMAIPLAPQTGALAGPPTALFAFPPGGNLITPFYSVTPDGQRFLLSQLVHHGRETPLVVLVDWTTRRTAR